MLGPTLETERLILRPPQAEDLDGWAELMGDEEAARFIGGVQPRAGAWRGLAAMTGSWALHGFGMVLAVGETRGRWGGGLRHVLGGRESERALGRASRPLAAGRLARHRGRLGPGAKRLGQGLCDRRR